MNKKSITHIIPLQNTQRESDRMKCLTFILGVQLIDINLRRLKATLDPRCMYILVSLTTFPTDCTSTSGMVRHDTCRQNCTVDRRL